MSDARFLTFPIRLISNGINDKVLNDIIDAGIYFIAKKEGYYGNKTERTRKAKEYLGINGGSLEATYNNGEYIFKNAGEKPPLCSVNKVTIFQFRDEEKTEFENIVLLAYLAIRSILQTKPYVKMDNQFLFSRMAGRRENIPDKPLPEHLLKYCNRYWINKIFTELENFGLKYYSRFTRGYYVSFDLEFEQLVTIAENRKKTYLEKQKKIEKQEIINRVLAKIQTTP